MTKLYAPQNYWRLSPRAKNEICNGCGPRSKFDFVPDRIWRLNISEACNIHDYMYSIGCGLKHKETADRIFLNNMLRIIEDNTEWHWLRWLRRRRAWKYYATVKYLGGPAFWNKKNNGNTFKKVPHYKIPTPTPISIPKVIKPPRANKAKTIKSGGL